MLCKNISTDNAENVCTFTRLFNRYTWIFILITTLILVSIGCNAAA